MGAHLIETLNFEFAFASDAEARELHGRVGDFARGRLLPMIDRVFDEFARPGEVIRLDRLEIDVGGDLWILGEAEAEERVRTALHEALNEALAFGEDGRPGRRERPVVERLDRGRADLEIVWAQLGSGRMPWRADAAAAADVDVLVAAVLRDFGAELVARLRAAPDLRLRLARLLRQWPAAQIAELERLFTSAAPAAAEQGARSARQSDVASLAGAAERLRAALLGEEAMAAELAVSPLAIAPASATAPPQSAPGDDGEALWRDLLAAPPAQVRTGLARLAAQGAVGPLLAAATPGRWTRLLTAWVAAAEAARLAQLVAQAGRWGLGSPDLPGVASVLGEAAVAHLTLDGRVDLQPAALAADLLTARAALAGLAPQAVAAALQMAWPAAEPLGADRAWLDALLEAAVGPLPQAVVPDRSPARLATADVATPSPTPRRATEPDTRAPEAGTAPEAQTPWDAVARRSAVAAWLDGAPQVEPDWAAALAEPAWFAAELLRRGRAAAWRRAFAARLDTDGVARIAGLWLAPRDASDLARLANPDFWPRPARDAPGGLSGPRLIEWLLAELLAPPGAERAAAAAAQGVLARVAEAAALHPAALAAELLERDAPSAGPGLAAAWRQVASASGGPRRPETAPQAAPPVRRLRQALRSASAETLDAMVRDGLGRPDRAAATELRRIARDPALRARAAAALSPAARAALVQPWLSDVQAEALLETLAAVGPPDADQARWEALFLAVLGATGRTVAAQPPAATPPAPTTSTSAAPTAEPGGAKPASPSPQGAGAPGVEPGAASAPSAAAQLRDDLRTDAARLAGLLARLPPRLEAPLREALERALSAQRGAPAVLAGLAEGQRRDLLARLRPADAAPALAAVDLLAAAIADSRAPQPAEGPPGFDWRFLWTELIDEGRRFDAAGFAARWMAARAIVAPGQDVSATWTAFVAALAQRAARAGGAAGAALVEAARARPAVLARRTPPAYTPTAPPASSPPQAQPPRIPDAWPFGEAAADETIYVANAGLVLLGPFVRPLLNRLELTRDAAFVDAAAAERAVHLLQFAVDGREGVAEHELVLNKLFCGLPLETPLDREFRATERERETIESLLTTLIAQWSILGRTSIAGLRDSFLRRQGALTETDDHWRLLVEPRSFDMLLDRIPWSFATQRLPWMAKVLHVDWR